MAETHLSLTTHGMNTLYQKGVYQTLKNFTINDAGKTYQINVEPNLEQFGGSRTLVTVAAGCEMSTTKPINKRKPTTQELERETLKLEWQLGKLDCGGTTYESNNPIITVNLKTWFNYLTNTIDNYSYENKLMLELTDSVKANLKVLNPSNYLYETKSTVEDLSINYIFDSVKSRDNYTSMNPYIMTVDNGVKTLMNNTKNRFSSYMTLVADTQENGIGAGNDWKLSFTVNSWGYVVKLADDLSTTFVSSDFVTISELESMSELEIKTKYRAIYPACIMSNTGKNSDLFVLEDTSGTYTKGIDMLPTYTKRFFNSDGLSLMARMIQIEENYIQTNFTESDTTPGLFEQQINLKVSNRTVNGITYPDNMIDGGNIQINFQWDSSETDNIYDNAVVWST
jgi:hypothetical protein